MSVPHKSSTVVSTCFLHARPCPTCEAENPVSPQCAWRAGVDSWSAAGHSSSIPARITCHDLCRIEGLLPGSCGRPESQNASAKGSGTREAGFGRRTCMLPPTPPTPNIVCHSTMQTPGTVLWRCTADLFPLGGAHSARPPPRRREPAQMPQDVSDRDCSSALASNRGSEV